MRSLFGSGAELNQYLHAMKNKTGSGPPDKEPEGELQLARYV
jgi:hypothetical protein